MRHQGTPLSIQLALQGGGAKLVHLIAVLEVIQEREAANRLRVTRVAGTSAGAIAGALYANRIPMSQLRAELKRIPVSAITAAFPEVGPAKFAWRALRNTPVWPTGHLRRLLNEKFGSKTVADLPLPFIAVSANIRDRSAVKSEPSTSVVNAVLDSAALPFFFRTVQRDDSVAFVDGGICENLPSDFLADQVDSHGPVVGVSFRDKSAPVAPTTALGFAAAIVDTAIANSVTRAQRSLRSRLLVIESDIGLFDFQRALSDGLDDNYDVVKHRAEEYFDRLESELHAEVGNALWEQPKSAVLDAIYEIYKSQHPEPYKTLRKSLCVDALTLAKDATSSTLDETTYTTIFEPSVADVFCIRIALNSSLNSAFWGTYVTVRDKDGKDVPHIKIPLLDRKTTRNRRQFLIYFTPPLRQRATNAPFELIVQDKIAASMFELREGRSDHLKLSSGSVDGTVGEIDLVLCVPAEFRELKMLPECSCSNEALTPLELKPYATPPGFRKLGWRFKSVISGQSVRVNFVP